MPSNITESGIYPSRHVRRGLGLGLGVRPGGQLDREVEDEARPVAGLGDAQLAAHLARQLAADGQAQPEAALARRRAAALEALEDALPVGRGDPGPLVVDGDRRRSLRDRRAPRAPSRPGARGAGRCRSGCARPAPRRRGRRCPSTARAERGPGARRRLAPARSSNSAATARHSSPSSTGSSRSVTAASRRLRSSSSLASRASRRSSRWARWTWRRSVLLVEAAVAQVLLEQLDRALQRGQRRAQLVRGGGDERAPRRLLAAQLALHGGQRPGEVADLVEAVVARGRGVGALPGDPHRGGAQAREAAAEAGGERMPSSTATARPAAAAARKALRTWLTAVATSVSCFCVTRTKSVERFGRRLAGGRRPLMEVTSSPLETVWRPDPRSRMAGARGPAVVGVVSGCSLGTESVDDHARPGAVAQRGRGRPRSRKLSRRSSRGRFSVFLRLAAIARRRAARRRGGPLQVARRLVVSRS